MDLKGLADKLEDAAYRLRQAEITLNHKCEKPHSPGLVQSDGTVILPPRIVLALKLDFSSGVDSISCVDNGDGTVTIMNGDEFSKRYLPDE